MVLYSAITCLTAISYAVLGLLVYITRPSRPLNRIFLFFCFMVALWALGYFYTLLPHTPYKEALAASRLSHAFGAFIPVAFFHFTLAFIQRLEGKERVLKIGYTISALIFFLAFTPLVVAELRSKMSLAFYPEKGPLYPLYALLFLIYAVGLAQYYLIRALLHSSGLIRKRLLFFIATSLLGFLGGVSLFLLIFNIPVPPYASALIILFPFAMAYTILRYNEFNIELIIKRSIVFTGLFLVVLAVVAIVFSMVRNFLGEAFGLNQNAAVTLSILLALLIYEPAKKMLIHFTDKLLFQREIEIQDVLNQLASNILTVLDLRKLTQTVVETIHELLRLETAVLLIQETGGNYQVAHSQGLKLWEEVMLSGTDPLVEFMQNRSGVVVLEEKAFEENIPEAASAKAKSYKAAVVVPLRHGNMIGLLMLGNKKSGQVFDSQELGYFPVLAGQIAAAVKNAQLYEDLRRNQEHIVHQTKMASIGMLSAAINHEIRNPLYCIKGLAEAEIAAIERMGKSNKENEKWGRLLQLTDRVFSVIHNLRRFALGSEGAGIDQETSSVQGAIDNVLLLVALEFKNTAVEVQTSIPPDLPQIQGGTIYVEAILLNVINNACQAVSSQGTVEVRGQVKETNVELEIRDSGAGMTKETLQLLFQPFFTTKGAAAGTGLGLYIARQLIERIGGGIRVESELGRGSCFYLSFRTASPMP